MTSTSVYREQANAARLASKRRDTASGMAAGFLHFDAYRRCPLAQQRESCPRQNVPPAFKNSAHIR